MASTRNAVAVDNDALLSITVRLHAWIDRLAVAWNPRLCDQVFGNVNTLVLFLGHPRSGHSIVRSVIDAHPNAIISHRLDWLKYLEAGLTPQKAFYLAWQNSRRFAAAGSYLTAYRYPIPNQWQGRFDTLRIIGDQEAKWTSIRLGRRPELLQRVRSIPGVKTKFIQVVRNPYDNIATWARRTASDLDTTTDRYFDLCRSVAQVREQIDESDLLVLHHEEFIADAETSLRHLCAFLNIDCSAQYLRDCAGLVYKTPNKTRSNLKWSSRTIEKVSAQCELYPTLKGYCYER